MLKLNYRETNGGFAGIVYIAIEKIVAVREWAGICRILTVAGIEYSVTASVDDVFQMIKESGYYA